MKPHPWFNPLYRRVAVAGLCISWTAFEGWYAPEGIWLWIAALMAGYAFWEFFVSGRYPTDADES